MNSMKQQLALSLRQSQQFFQNQCKICFLSFSDKEHYPMLVCEAHHLLCEQCFDSIKKDRKQIVCPFCKRNTKVSRVQRFKYALTANHLYAMIKGKYFQLLDLYDRTVSLGEERENAELQQLIGFQRYEKERRLPFAQMNSMITSLRVQLNETRQLYNVEVSQADKNKKRVEDLTKQLEVYKFKLHIFEKKCEMKEEQLEQVQRQSEERIFCLYQEVQRLNRLNHTQAESIAQLIKENTSLFRDNECMNEQMRKERQRTPKIEFIRSEIPEFQYQVSLKQAAVTDYDSDKQNQSFNFQH